MADPGLGREQGLQVNEATMRLPPAPDVQADFRRRGFVVVREFLNSDYSSILSTLASQAIDRFGRHITRPSATETLDYRVVTGEIVESDARPLFELYTSSQLIDWICDVTTVGDLTTSPYQRSAININCLHRAGQRYPWHTDAVPFTAVLFLTTSEPADGGEFLIRPFDQEVIEVRPTKGDLLLMDGKRCAHAVAPLRRDSVRITVPMVYPAQRVERPPGLDDYLYETTTTRV
jgi:hypothetical protein